MNRHQDITYTERAIFIARAKTINREVGILAISLGIGVLGTDAPRTFAFSSMIIVLLFMLYRLQSYNRVYALWRQVNHSYTQARKVWRHFPVFNIGWALLGLIALGLITKHGLLGIALP